MRKPDEEAHDEQAYEMSPETEYNTPITEIVKTGKVRNIHAFTGLIFETSNRLSVFDRVIKEDVPLKGAMLNCISQHNKMLLNDYGFITDYIPVPGIFFVSAGFPIGDVSRLCYAEELTMLPFEFIVRGYLVGSAYKAYSKGESYCGFTFPEGLKEGDKLPEPIVTPTTKEENGHDRPVTKEECIEQLAFWLIDNSMVSDAEEIAECFDSDFPLFLAEMVDELDTDSYDFADCNASEDDWEYAKYAIAYQCAKEYVETVYQDSLEAYSILSEHCEKAGIMFIDTKFEFGLNPDNEVVLADEVGTPDSSRFAPIAEYANTGKIISMDKQIVRDYCKSIGFTGDADQPIPEIPDEIWEKVTATYVHIAELICGKKFVKQYL